MTDAIKEHGRGKPGANRRCPDCLCGGHAEYDDQFDAHYCPVSGVWLEEKCSASDITDITDEDFCEFCSKRPDVRVMEPK
jgi:hypothetical protein